ncbi:MAG: hypothetical protein IAE99_12040 [Rhodothermales bacterium]|nr:hypothetical protein [Rhodothermales bacterium]
MLRRACALVLLLAAVPAWAQNVRLQLVDHIVGSALLHNTPLPAGTKVWVMGKADARPTRLRGGYGEVLGSLASATQDELAANGFTRNTYAPTARSKRSLFVVARLPDGRLFQSYVKTSDDGWQPGFDAIREGRVSMGRMPASVASRFDATLAPAFDSARTTAPAPPFVDTATQAVERAGLPSASDSLAASDTLLADSAAAAAGVEPVDAVPSNAVAVDDGGGVPPSKRGWAWLPFAVGLFVGGLLAGLVVRSNYKKRLLRQRDRLMRLVPTEADRAREEAEQAERLREAEATAQQRTDRVFQQIELLQEALKARDNEIARLRRIQE